MRNKFLPLLLVKRRHDLRCGAAFAGTTATTTTTTKVAPTMTTTTTTKVAATPAPPLARSSRSTPKTTMSFCRMAGSTHVASGFSLKEFKVGQESPSVGYTLKGKSTKSPR